MWIFKNNQRIAAFERGYGGLSLKLILKNAEIHEMILMIGTPHLTFTMCIPSPCMYVQRRLLCDSTVTLPRKFWIGNYREETNRGKGGGR